MGGGPGPRPNPDPGMPLVGGGEATFSPPSFSFLHPHLPPVLLAHRGVCLWPSAKGGHIAYYRATPYFTDLNTASQDPFFLSLVPAMWLLAAPR